MKTGFTQILEGLAERQLKTIPIASIRCVELKVPNDEGWGGKPIEYFPPYRFFKLYSIGKQTAAVQGMENWYCDRIICDNLIEVPKTDGGMAGGSFFNELVRLHSAQGLKLAVDMSNADYGIVREAIRQRVQYRFSIFESIRQRGLSFTWDFVRLVPAGNVFFLRGGHHRVAALAVCGSSNVCATVSESVYLKVLRRSATGILRK